MSVYILHVRDKWEWSRSEAGHISMITLSIANMFGVYPKSFFGFSFVEEPSGSGKHPISLLSLLDFWVPPLEFWDTSCTLADFILSTDCYWGEWSLVTCFFICLYCIDYFFTFFVIAMHIVYEFVEGYVSLNLCYQLFCLFFSHLIFDTLLIQARNCTHLYCWMYMVLYAGSTKHPLDEF